MRSVISKDQFTPFGLWLRQYCRDSRTGLAVTNLDYIVEDFKAKKIMLIEEKQNNGELHYGQQMTFKVLDQILTHHASEHGYSYEGFFVVRFPKGCDMPGPGMTINGVVVTTEQLAEHLNFKKSAAPPLDLTPVRHS